MLNFHPIAKTRINKSFFWPVRAISNSASRKLCPHKSQTSFLTSSNLLSSRVMKLRILIVSPLKPMHKDKHLFHFNTYNILIALENVKASGLNNDKYNGRLKDIFYLNFSVKNSYFIIFFFNRGRLSEWVVEMLEWQ
jgi:hypothetical protein